LGEGLAAEPKRDGEKTERRADARRPVSGALAQNAQGKLLLFVDFGELDRPRCPESGSVATVKRRLVCGRGSW